MSRWFLKCRYMSTEISLANEYMRLVFQAMESADDAFLVSRSCEMVYEHLYHYQSDRFWRIVGEGQLKFHRKKDFNIFLRLLEPGLTDFDAEKLGLILGVLDSDHFTRTFSSMTSFSPTIKFVMKIFDRLDIHFLDLIPDLWGDADLEMARPKLKVDDDFLSLRERALGPMRPRLVSFVELYKKKFRESMFLKNTDFLSAGTEFYHLIESRNGSQSFFTLVRNTDFKNSFTNICKGNLFMFLLQYHRFMSKIEEEGGWKGVNVQVSDKETDPLATDLLGIYSLSSSFDFLEIEKCILEGLKKPIKFWSSTNSRVKSILFTMVYMSEIIKRKAQSEQDPREKFVSVDFDNLCVDLVKRQYFSISKMLCRGGLTWSELLCFFDILLKVKNYMNLNLEIIQMSHLIQLAFRLVCFRCLESEPTVENLEAISGILRIVRDNDVKCPQFEEFLKRFEEGAEKQELSDLYFKFRLSFKKDLIRND